MADQKKHIFSQGAEATLSRQKMMGTSVVLKQRIPKTYRHSDLDTKLRNERMAREARMLHAVKKIDVNAPVVMGVDFVDCALYLEDIPGKTLKEKLLSEKNNTIRKKWMTVFGKMIGTMHSHALIHGDLTTSNVMVSPPAPSLEKKHTGQKKSKKKASEKLTLIDFGLAYHSGKLEDKAVDLLNLKKTFLATHVDFPRGWTYFQEGYASTHSKGTTVLKHVETVEGRIRYA